MKICFLGTGAADWKKGIVDSCGMHRFFSSILIDDTMLIDPGPDIFIFAHEHGVDISKIRYVINTHSHSDHFNAENLSILQATGAEFVEFVPSQVKSIGKYTVESFSANHATCENSLHFIISDGERVLFYGLDGAWLMQDEINAIRDRKVNLAIFDATVGDIHGDFRIFYEHNNLFMVEELKSGLESYIERFMISHMAYTLHTDHDTLVKRMKPSGIEVAFDGLVTEV